MNKVVEKWDEILQIVKTEHDPVSYTHLETVVCR